jgi:hypothetical protein
MSVYHAIHPSPYADDCPDCAGYEPWTAYHREPTRRRWVAVLIAALAAAWRKAR